MGDDGIGAGCPEIVGAQSFQDLMGQTIGGGQRQFESLTIGDPSAIEIGRLAGVFRSELRNLVGGPVDQHNTDVQRAQDGDVEQEIGEDIVGDDDAVDGNDERPFPEAGDVAEDSAQIDWFHR